MQIITMMIGLRSIIIIIIITTSIILLMVMVMVIVRAMVIFSVKSEDQLGATIDGSCLPSWILVYLPVKSWLI